MQVCIGVGGGCEGLWEGETKREIYRCACVLIVVCLMCLI